MNDHYAAMAAAEITIKQMTRKINREIPKPKGPRKLRKQKKIQ